jgi:hypothetical protein
MLDFSSDASPKSLINIIIKTGDIFSNNTTNFGGPQRKASGGRIGGSNWGA